MDGYIVCISIITIFNQLAQSNIRLSDKPFPKFTQQGGIYSELNVGAICQFIDADILFIHGSFEFYSLELL